MNGGISDYCHPCSSADSVMLMLIPPFGSADGGDVALLSHLLAGVATDVCAFHQQVLSSFLLSIMHTPVPGVQKHVRYHFY